MNIHCLADILISITSLKWCVNDGNHLFDLFDARPKTMRSKLKRTVFIIIIIIIVYVCALHEPVYVAAVLLGAEVFGWKKLYIYATFDVCYM